MLALPSLRSWYAEALKESWRDEAHEKEIEQEGTLLEDLRT